MKRIFTLLCLVCFAFACANSKTTTDKVVITAKTINPGAKETTVTFKLSGSTIYTAYGMQIYAPEGYTIIKATQNKSIYPYELEDPEDEGSEKNYTHNLTYNVQTDGSIILSCASSNTDNFTATSGTLFTLTVKASPWAKPGPVNFTIYQGFFVTDDATQCDLEADANEKVEISGVTTGTSCTLPINVTAANKWGTITSPFDITEIPAGLTAYTISGIEGENVNLSKATKIEAFKPYVLEASADVNTTLNGTVDAEAYATAVTSGLAASSNATAVYSAQNITSGYVLQNQGSEAMFYQLPSEGLKIPAGKVVVTGTSGAKALNFVVEEDEATVINKIENASNSDAIYDIQGRRVATPKHGIYIKGGKKIAM